MTTNTIQVATAVIFGTDAHDGQCLYTFRKTGKMRGALWEHPGGKLEHGETIREAAVRECREELGVEVAIVGDLATVSMDLVTHVIVLNAVAARIVKGEPRSLKSDGLRWMDPQDAVEREPCTPGTYLIHRAVDSWQRRLIDHRKMRAFE